MSKNIFRLIICLLMLINVTVKAQNTSNAQLFGQGVHAYNIGEYQTALNIFNSAIEQGTEDPRVFLFRGLVYHHQGKTKEALTDLKKGAELEAVDKRGFYPVAPALIRVQGKVRLQVERLRREARVNLVQIEKARNAARYEEQKTNEAVALRKPMPNPAPVIPRDAQQTIRPENPFTGSNLAGIKSNPSNVTVSKKNPKPSVDDKDPLANLNNDNPMPANPVTTTPPTANNPFAPGNDAPPANNTPPATNNPFAPGNDAPPANNKPPATNNPFAPGNDAPPANNSPPATDNPPTGDNPLKGGEEPKGGGTLGAIFGSLNPFGGDNPQPVPNPADEGEVPTSLDQIKKFIQGNLPGGQPAPDGKQPAPNPFK